MPCLGDAMEHIHTKQREVPIIQTQIKLINLSFKHLPSQESNPDGNILPMQVVNALE